MDIFRFQSLQEFTQESVSWITGKITESQKEGMSFSLGLSGGSTPRPVYELLPNMKGIQWSNVEIFLVDERYVPSSDPESNQKLVRETLMGEGSTGETLFPDTALPIDQCTVEYDKALTQKIPDLVILGMGEDAHVASLFPPLSPEAFGPASVIHTTTHSMNSGQADPFKVKDRISTTLPFLKRAKHRLFLISGPKKATLLKTMQQTNEDASLYPAQYLFDERTTWMVGP